MFEDGNGVKIIIPKHIDFDEPILTSVDVTSFHRDYSEISLADGRRLIDACNHRVIQTNGCAEDDQVLCVPNPWRLKANGKVIRHVPITLYADDTSGNEFNCHFLLTSNVASVLELSEQIVDEINDMALEGFTAYDSHIAEPALVHSVVLCFLADSPMHAEVTNTPNPGQSNHPCRMCTLSVKKKSMMKSVPYIQQFIQVDDLGHRASIHSNRQSPGKDLAVTFDNYSSLKFLLSGGVMFDPHTGSTTPSSSEVQHAFVNNPILQRAMGYNCTVTEEVVCYPLDVNIKLPKEDIVPAPNRLSFPGQNASVAQVAQIKLSKHDLLRKGVFLAVILR
ncbi:hypothetical protein PCASD_08454 [Puccinia coronata f. sp. avenae]|uniref:Uncharacterized protein n=1 Tax=Puccinia coronata f. sp. avenae TaxID=200324 RepID=A0A2N5UMY9_9BASI|nr:hypothetical protein PCASD_08454 [Puccinia coronata f. sp. avenae]